MKIDNYNYGCALLRMLMCFEVVCCHFWENNSSAVLSPFFMIRNFAVPVFMFLSFFLSGNLFCRADNLSAGKRIWRLAWPLWVWALIYFLADGMNSWSALLWQMTTGHSAELNPAMWYQSVLICMTVLLFVIGKYTNTQIRNVILIGLAAASLLIQYLGYNFAWFKDLPYELKYPVGRFVEMIPYASLGVLTAQFPERIKVRKHRITAIILCGGMAVCFAVLKAVIADPPGFQYAGAPSVGAAVVVVLFVYALPMEKLPPVFKKGVMVASRYTLGIYCMHNLIGKFLTILISKTGINVNGFILCVIIYIACYGISWCIAKIPNRHIRMLVC